MPCSFSTPTLILFKSKQFVRIKFFSTDETLDIKGSLDSNDVPAASYYFHKRFINRARLEVARFKGINLRLPTDTEFGALMELLLNQPLPEPVALSISNMPPAIATNSVLNVQLLNRQDYPTPAVA